MAESSIKKSGVYGLFGKRYGDILINVLQGCCNGIADFGNFCNVVKDCIGVDEINGDNTLFLNQKGEWVEISSGGIQSIVEGANIIIDNTDPLNPIVSAIVPAYTFTSTDSIDLVDNTGVITADIILDPNPLNTASVSANGLLVLGSTPDTYTKEQFLDLTTGNSITLANTPNAKPVLIFRNGMFQFEGVDYTISGTSVTFTIPFGMGGGETGAEDVAALYWH